MAGCYTPAHRGQRHVCRVLAAPAVNAFFAGVRFRNGELRLAQFVALNDESASEIPVSDFTPVWTVCLPPASAARRIHMVSPKRCFEHQPGNQQAERALNGAAGPCSV
ncbi:hypothetical protein ACLK1T_22685 [Escherichia coli]